MKRLLIVVIAGAALVVPAPAGAVWSRLSEQQVQEAVSHGTAVHERWRREGGTIDDTDPEYVVDLGPEIGQATLLTEFSTVTLETRRWLAIGRTIERREIEAIAGDFRQQIRFSVVLVGNSRNFLRHYTVQLVQEGASRAPLSGEVFRGVRQDASGRWLAQGHYAFDVKDLNVTGRCTLVLQDQGGRQVHFDFDLSRLR